MKGKLVFRALDIIGDISVTSVALSIGLIISPYGSSQSRLEYNTNRVKEEILNAIQDTKNVVAEKRKYRNLIYRLKKTGLVSEFKNEKNEKCFRLTKKGRDLRQDFKDGKILPEVIYENQNEDKYVLVIFDIPEKYAKKRRWLRSVLKNLDFDMEQKSVWVGKTGIPKELLDDLFNLKLIPFIKIFEITKKGSLEKVI